MAVERAHASAPAWVFDGRVAGLDALRALAVVLVVVYHLFPSALPGGFVGVDIFFVVSGFLITGLLLAEQRRSGRIRLWSFWRRRVRRLVPGLVVMLMLCTAAAAALGGDLLVGIRRQLVGALTFTSNWLSIAAGSSYARGFSPELYTHTWSLAVEEQFYLWWPPVIVVILLLAARSRRRAAVLLGATAGALAVASAVAMALMAGWSLDPTRVYYGTDTHLFGLMAGAGLAVAISSDRGGRLLWLARSSARARAAATFVLILCAAALCLLAAVLRWESEWTYRGGLVLVAALTVGAIGALLVLPENSEAAERGALSWVGTHSYGLYLYHWPLWVLVQGAWPGSAAFGRGVAVVVLTIVLTGLSFRYIEQPMRRQGIRASWRRTLRAWRPSAAARTPQSLRLRRRSVVVGTLVVVAAVGTGWAAVSAPRQTALQQQLAAGLIAADSTDPDVLTSAGTGAGTPPVVPVTPSASAPASSAPATSPKPAVTTDVPTPTGRNISVIGDSVTVAGAADLKSSLPGIVISAKVGRQMVEAPDIAAELAKRDRLRSYVVISLVTNSTVTDRTVDDLLEAIGSHRAVILVTGHGDRPWIGPANKVLRRAAKEHPQVVLADWDAVASEHPAMLGPDGIHPRSGNTRRYTQVIEDALAQAATEVFGR